MSARRSVWSRRNLWTGALVGLSVAFLCLRADGAEASLTPQASSGAQPLINNVWVDVPLTQVLRDVSLQARVTIAADPSVTDHLVSLEAQGMPVEECLRRLTAGQGLSVRKVDNNLYIVGSVRSDSPSFGALADVRRVYLKYVTARHVRDCLPRGLQPYVSSGERKTELLVVAPSEEMERIAQIVGQLDVPLEQVVLEALVVELSEEAAKEWGIDWERSGRDTLFSLKEGMDAFVGVARRTSINEREFRTLMVTLRMLVLNGRASIRSRPRVATLNGEQATIDVSLEEYFNIITDVNGAFLRTELQVVKSGVMLKMTPQIGQDGDITVQVTTEVSDVASRQNTVVGHDAEAAGTLPVIRRRKADTRVTVKEGDAIVIGGLIETQERNQVKKVPVLGSLPVIGVLFRATQDTTVQKEVVIFITPHVVGAEPSAPANSHRLLDVEAELAKLRRSPPPAGYSGEGLQLMREGVQQARTAMPSPQQ